MKKIFNTSKKLLFNASIIYGFNAIMSGSNLCIPLNVYTILCIMILGFPGLFLIVGLLLII